MTGQLVEATAKQILHLRKTIEAQEARMVAQCRMPEVELLKSLPGISDASAIGLMIEIQDVQRFASAKKLAAFFGLHPAYKISGDGSGGFRMSKQGRKEPRRILFMVALSAIRCNRLIRDLYEHHLAKGKAKMDAIGVCMHKILRIIYGMLKHQAPFDPQQDLRNRQRSVRKAAETPSKDKSRRFQDFDPCAPISRRQNQKRKERKQPQGVSHTMCGVKTPVPEPVS